MPVRDYQKLLEKSVETMIYEELKKKITKDTNTLIVFVIRDFHNN